MKKVGEDGVTEGRRQVGEEGREGGMENWKVAGWKVGGGMKIGGRDGGWEGSREGGRR